MVASRKLGMEGDEWLSNALPSLIAPYKKTYPDLLKNNPQISEIITREVDQFRKTIKNGLDNVEKVEETAKNLYKLSSLVTTELDWLGNLQSIMDFLIRNQFPRNIKLLFNNKELINTYLIKEQREKLNELMKIVIHAGLSTSYLLKEQEKENFNPSMEDLKKIIGVLNYFKDHKIKLNSEWAFKYITTYGVPLEILQELAEERNIDVDVSNLDRLNREHQELSRTTSAGVFRGGLANHSPEVIKLHTATHLLLSTLRKILGDHVVQKGQNITSERSRFDFPNPEKLTNEQIKKVENNVNEIISKDLPVNFIVMPKDEALNTGAIHAFNEKYADTVKVYFVGKSLEDAVSREFCGGPHVSHTGEIGHVRIKKQEKIGSGLIRIYMVLTN